MSSISKIIVQTHTHTNIQTDTQLNALPGPLRSLCNCNSSKPVQIISCLNTDETSEIFSCYTVLIH